MAKGKDYPRLTVKCASGFSINSSSITMLVSLANQSILSVTTHLGKKQAPYD